jgi:hypothetical protein
MVEFCTVCGTSLPKGDLTVKGGKVFTSHDYDCPSCHKVANPDKSEGAGSSEPSPEQDLVFKKGIVKSE